MSLINDALKKAGEGSRRRRRTLQPAPLTALRPVDRLDRGTAGLKWVGFFLILSFGAAVWLLWRSGDPVRELESVRLTQPAPPVPVTSSEPPKPAAPEPPATENSPALTEPEQIRVNTNLVSRLSVGATDSDVPPPPVVADLEPQRPEPVRAAAPFPDIRLQSIIYREGNPMAMINGETVVPGDRVAGVLVFEIRRDSVVLVWGEEQREFRLREP